MVIQMIARINPPGGSSRWTAWVGSGWADQWLYAHGAGAIGASGPVPSVRAEFVGRLRAYGLPDPPDYPATCAAGGPRASRGSVPCRPKGRDGRHGIRGPHPAAAGGVQPFQCERASRRHDRRQEVCAGPGDLEVFRGIAGPGMLAPGRVDRHRGQPAIRLPRRRRFAARDRRAEVAEHGPRSEALFQDQANGAARARMSSDGVTPRKSLDPRGSVLSTGEIDPKTRSSLGTRAIRRACRRRHRRRDLVGVAG